MGVFGPKDAMLYVDTGRPLPFERIFSIEKLNLTNRHKDTWRASQINPSI
jgi:hypothetical protein